MECPRCGRAYEKGNGYCYHCEKATGVPQTPTPGVRSAHNGPFGDGEAERVDPVEPRRYEPFFDTEKGERRLITVLFADTANYTAMADSMDPEDVCQIIGGCFSALYAFVQESAGIVTTFSGDGIMALYGAPVAREDHAQRACHSAIEMQRFMGTYGAEILAKFGLVFALRIGINSGLAVVGRFGNNYTAIGDTVNVGSRLQSWGTPGSIVVSKSTHDLVHRHFLFTEMDPAVVKGKARQIEAFELLGPRKPGLSQCHETGPDTSSRFVGRERELLRLKKAFDRACTTKGVAIGLSGEAGAGKTTLIRQFKRSLTPEDHCLLSGECLNFGSPIAFLPVVGMLRSLFAIDENVTEAEATDRVDEYLKQTAIDILRDGPVLKEFLSLPVMEDSPIAVDPKKKRDIVFDALRRLLVSAGRLTPLVVIIENLQWIDPSSEEFLAYLMPYLSGIRMLLVLIYRPEYRAPWSRQPDFIGLELHGLDETETPRLIESLLQGQKASDQLQDFVVNRARGNPLFVEELVFSLITGGHIREQQGTFVFDKKPASVGIPNTLHGVIMARIDELAEEQKHILQIAAVLGRNFDGAILADLAPPAIDLRQALLELEARDFIVPKGGQNSSAYEFRHDLLQEVAYNTMLLRRRKEMHEVAAHLFEEVYKEALTDYYEILAHHYSLSADLHKAYHYQRLSAIKAGRSSSLREEFRFYREAIDTLARLPSSPDKATKEMDLFLLILSPMISLGFPEDSLVILERGLALAQRLNLSHQCATLSSMIGLFHSVKGDLASGQTWTDAAFATADEMGDIEIMAPAAFDLCSNYAARGEFLKVREVADRMTRLLENNNRRQDNFNRGYNIYSSLLGFWGFSEGYLGRFHDGEELCRKGIEYCLSLENVSSLGLLETCYGYVLAHKGEGREAIPHFLKAIAYLEEGNITVLLGLAWSGLGWAHFFTGNLSAAKKYVEKGIAINAEAGIHYKSAVPYCFSAVILLAQEDLQGSLHSANEARRLAEAGAELYVQGIAGILAGIASAMITSTDNTLEASERDILAGLEVLKRLQIVPFFGIGNYYLATYYQARNRIDEARTALSVARQVFDKTEMAYWNGEASRRISCVQWPPSNHYPQSQDLLP